ncbi:hypothetical protein [Aeromonas sp. 600886]|uniref:hypothetical protein n=1 Tax=Aeromonas sp. 600886 TaxID=2712033 RepID=UPI003BA020B4
MRNVITVVIEGDDEKMKNFNFGALAERIHRCCQGEEIDGVKGTEGAEFKSCDGINIKGWICIGSSK